MLTEEFELSLPLTPYRPYDPADVEGGRRRVLIGVEGMISDTASLTVRDGSNGHLFSLLLCFKLTNPRAISCPFFFVFRSFRYIELLVGVCSLFARAVSHNTKPSRWFTCVVVRDLFVGVTLFDCHVRTCRPLPLRRFPKATGSTTLSCPPFTSFPFVPANLQSGQEMCVNLAEQCRQRASLGGGGGDGGGGGAAAGGAASGGGGGGGQPRPRVQLRAHVSGGDLAFSSGEGGGEGVMCVFSITTVDAW